MPVIRKGENILVVKMPFAERKNPEWMYILGEFDVKLIGKYKKIVPIDEEKGFGSVVGQGMPFYGGNLIYECEFETKTDGDAYIKCEGFRGPVIRAFVDNEDTGVIAIQPYTVKKEKLKAGKHKLKLILCNIVFLKKLHYFCILGKYASCFFKGILIHRFYYKLKNAFFLNSCSKSCYICYVWYVKTFCRHTAIDIWFYGIGQHIVRMFFF